MRGDSKRQLLDYAGAVADYSTALQYDPGDKEAYRKRAQVNEELGSFEAAEADLTKLIEMYKNWAPAYRDRARVRAFMSKLSGSNDDFEAAIFLAPKDPANYTTRARIRKMAGDYDGAVEDCDKAVECDPDQFHGYYIRALVHYDFGNYRKARLDLLKSVKRAPGDADYQNLYLCLIRMRQDRWDRGIKELKEHFAKKEHEPEEWYATVVRFLCKEIDEEAFLAAAKDETPKKTRERQCEAFFYAGTVRLAAGDEEGAREFFRKSVATEVRTFIEYESSVIELKRK
jgi:lipoprotein NlpI